MGDKTGAPVVEVSAPPPHSVESEQAVIGGLLLDPNAYDRVDWLKPEAFYRSDHRAIYGCLIALLEAGRPVDALLLCEALRARGELDNVGGQAYVTSLGLNALSAANIKRYAEIVRDKALLRELMVVGMEITDGAMQPGCEPAALRDAVEARIFALGEQRGAPELVDFARATGEAVDWLESPEHGLGTGFDSLDRILGGLRPSDLIVLAGRPSMGKTSLALNIAEWVGQRHPVALFTMEMSRRQIAARSLAYHEKNLGRHDAVKFLFGLKIHIDDSPAVTVGHIRMRLRRMVRKHGLGLVVVDYLQLMTAKAENRTQEVSEISRGLKSLAKEFNVPVLCVSQLSRAPEQRSDHRPIMSDLRESGQIEQDADVIAFVYRDEYYREDTHLKGLAEVIVRKHRDGPTGTVYLRFEPEVTRFHDFAQGSVPRTDPPALRRSAVTRVDFKKNATGDAE